MRNKNTVIQFIKDKGFYIALAVCIVGAAAAAWATAARTLDSIQENNRQIVEQGVSGEEKPSWNSSSTADRSGASDNHREKETEKTIPNTEKPSSSSTSAPSSSSAAEPSSGSGQAAAEPQTPQGSPTFVYTRPLAELDVIGPYSGGRLVKNKTLNVWRTHDAVDLKGEKGEKVFAIGDGKVVSAENDTLWGGVVQIQHPDGVTSTYSGLVIGENIKADAEVKTGDEIGTLGDIPAEISAETHLHLALAREGKPVDPGEVLELD